jgi:crossover junction endodeoxyribonuclease RuvC
MIIMGIDPGIGRVGWGLISENNFKQNLIEVGCLETDPKLPEEKRLKQVHIFIRELIQKYKPDVAAVESLFFTTNAKTAISVGQARGVILLAIADENVTLFSYTPLQVKQSISGYGKADKNQVQQMVKSLLKLPQIPKPDDAADALAIALTHAFNYKVRNGLKLSTNKTNVLPTK